MSSWNCLLCGAAIAGHRHQAAHMRNYNLRANNPRRCDNILRRQNLGQPLPVAFVTQPVVTQPVVTQPVVAQPQPVRRGPGTVATIRLPTRRASRSDAAGMYLELFPPARTTPYPTQTVALDFVNVQRAWQRLNFPNTFHVFKPPESHVFKPAESHVLKPTESHVFKPTESHI